MHSRTQQQAPERKCNSSLGTPSSACRGCVRCTPQCSPGTGREPGLRPQRADARCPRCRYDLDAALKFYEKAVQLEPDNTDLLDAAGELCVEAGRSDDARKLFARSVELKPQENSCKYMNLGMLAAGPDALNFYRKGMELMAAELAAAKAAGEQEQVAKLNDRMCSAHCSVCELHMTDLCDEDKAEETCEQSLQQAQTFAPNSPDLWVQWANLRLVQQNKAEATKFTHRAVSLTKKLDEADRPSLEQRCAMVVRILACKEMDSCSGGVEWVAYMYHDVETSMHAYTDRQTDMRIQ